MPWLTYSLSHEGTDDAHVAADEVAVTSKIPERIDRILVDTNQPVRRGQLLIVLDNKDELAKLRQAQAQYDLAAANQRATTEQGQGGVSQASGADCERAGASTGSARRRRASQRATARRASASSGGAAGVR